MIPEFPAFKPLALSDQDAVEAMTAPFPPYSDFNFVSLWSWNTDGRCAISELNGNLVIRLNDYLTSEPFLSFLGVNAIEKTAAALLDHAEQNGLMPRLRLVPECVITQGTALNEALQVDEDQGGADYLLSVPEWVAMAGGKFLDKRKTLRRFVKTFAPSFHELDLRSTAVQREVTRIFGLWLLQRDHIADTDAINEAVAVRRFFAVERFDRLHGFSVEAEGEMRAFALVERLDDGYLLGHFWKADLAFPGIYLYLLHEMCRRFEPLGYRLFNIEQDLGKSGLAQSKRLYRPCGFLRKYEIARPCASEPSQCFTVDASLLRNQRADAPWREVAGVA